MTLKYLKNVNIFFKYKYPISSISQFSTQKHNDYYYVSTPIYYVNAEPHIGHLYSTLIADALARWQRLSGNNVIFSTGTDEHGLKIQQAARNIKQENLAFCDNVSLKYKKIFDETDISYTNFIRTTSKEHQNIAQDFWKEIDSNGHIYKGSYQGWYCISDEAFLNDDDCIKHPEGHLISKESGHIVEWIKEDNYMFKLSSFREPLLKWIKDNKRLKLSIFPVQFEPIVLSWLNSGDLPDLSISRSTRRLQWGVPIVGDDTQKMYVWMDALSNYLTTMKYKTTGNFNWPPTCQVIGKDILKFHAVYWPALLMAANLAPPLRILAHSHWTINGKKMSKSKGNVVDPKDLIAKYNSESVRYFLLRQGIPHSDSNFCESRLVSTVNDELVNTLCNLLSRCCSRSLNPKLQIDYYDDKLIDDSLVKELHNLLEVSEVHYQAGNLYRVLETCVSFLKGVNGFVQRLEPWHLRKSEDVDDVYLADTVVSFALTSVQVVSILMQPIIPRTTCKILDKLSVNKDDRLFSSIYSKSNLPRSLSNDSNVIFERLKKK